MPDWNPDKEKHVGHKWIVHNATRKPMTGVKVDDGNKELKFGRDGWLRLSDEAQASEIRQNYGMDVTVTRVRHPHVSDRGHRFFFGGQPAMPWARYDELGRRIKEKQDGNQEESPPQEESGQD